MNQRIKMARSNFNFSQSACLLLLEADALKLDTCAPEEAELNSLKIANTIFVLKKPDELLKWLGLENNLTKLIKFIIAVCDKYNEFAADYNNFDINRDNQLATKNQKKAVIQYF